MKVEKSLHSARVLESATMDLPTSTQYFSVVEYTSSDSEPEPADRFV